MFLWFFFQIIFFSFVFCVCFPLLWLEFPVSIAHILDLPGNCFFSLSQDASKNLQNLLETFQGSCKNFTGVEWVIYEEKVLMLAYSLLISLYSF